MLLKKLFILGDIGFLNNNLRSSVFNIQKNIKNNDALVLLGDNFYENGISSKCDEVINHFIDIFKNINNPIYSILGNHDYKSNPSAQLNHTEWIMPNYYYKKEYSNIDLLFLDTVIFNTHFSIDKSKIENVHNDNIDNLINKQLNWLEDNLKYNKNKKKVVFGHYPIITNGYYKKKGEDVLIYDYLFEIFKKYNISAYISGHEHNIQYIKREDNDFKLNQIIIGSSAENRHWEKDYSEKEDMYDNSDNFYGQLSIEPELKIDYVNKDGIVIYSYKL